MGAACERTNSGEFVLEWSMRVKVDVLVCMCRFSKDVEGEGSIHVAFEVDMEHVNGSIDFVLIGSIPNQPLSLSLVFIVSISPFPLFFLHFNVIFLYLIHVSISLP